jgi:hypothetical protein
MDSRTQERAAPVKAPFAISGARVRPSNSKMLTTYLADIEQMLDEHSWEAALRDSLDLPSIAVALSDPQLRSSAEAIRKWLADWIRPLQSDSGELAHERISQMLTERATSGHKDTRVPAQALRRLRLRRLARTPPGRFAAERSRLPDGEGKDATEMCKLVVEAVHRWYANNGCSDPVLQANLGRLAILR